MWSTRTGPVAAELKDGGGTSAKTSCDGTSGTSPDRKPGPDRRNPLGSWSRTHVLPAGKFQQLRLKIGALGRVRQDEPTSH